MARIIPAFMQFFDDNGDPLVEGWLRFTVSGTNNTDKNTYADSAETIANTNPLQLDGAGRCPNVFGTGSYNVRSYTNVGGAPGVQIQQFDPVGGVDAGGQFSEWLSATIYGVNDIVIGSDDKYYRSIVASNQNNDPTISPQQWEEVQLVGAYNQYITYAAGEIALDADGYLYRSLQAANLNKTPADNPDWWGPAVLQTDLAASVLTHNMASDADYSLTTSENRYGQIVITDTGVVLTTGRNIVVSLEGRVFTAKNNTAQTLTFKTLAGTGIAVPPSTSATLICDGTNVIDITPPSIAISGVYRNLTIANNGATPNSKLDIAVTEIILQDASGSPKRVSAFSGTVDITLTGAGGRDAGSEAANTWYYVHIIAGSSVSTSSILSTSATTPTLPTGYTHWAFVGAVRNGATSNFVPFSQVDKEAILTPPLTIIDGGGTATTWTALSVSAYVPPAAKKYNFIQAGARPLGMSHLSTGYGMQAHHAGLGTAFDMGILPTARDNIHCPLIRGGAASVYYYAGSANVTIMANGWVF